MNIKMEVVRGEDVYLLKELLGKGGFSNVYHTELKEKSYAIKVITKTENQKEIRLFRNEIAIHSSISHPNIVGYDGHFENDENYYIILEYCNSKTMAELFRRTPFFTLNEITGLILQLIDAVSYLHSRNIVHCDIKLGNIFMHDVLQVKLGDFGLSTQLKSSDDKIRRTCGTPNYMAPEILNSIPYSFSVDIWAICVILYALVYKRMPFEKETAQKTYQKIKLCDYHILEIDPDLSVFEEIFESEFCLEVSNRMSLDELKLFMLNAAMSNDENSTIILDP